MTTIGNLNESDLHADVKMYCAGPDDRLEETVDGFVIDVARADGELVEVQTANFGQMRAKLDALLPVHRLRIIYPLAQEKWIVKIGPEGQILSRRRSPKKERVEALFSQLVAIPQAMAHPHFALDVLLVRAEEVWRAHDRQGKRGWRRGGWIVHNRRLLDVVACCPFDTPEQLAQLLPVDLPHPFTTAELATASRLPRRLAGQMAYCLREMGQIRLVGKRGNALLYESMC